MADLVNIIMARHGLAPEPEPVEPATLHGSAERHREALVLALHEARTAIEILQGFIVDHADREDLLELGAHNLGHFMISAGDALDRFRLTRDCKGEA